MIKLISFDLDGTLVDNTNLDVVFWYEEVPKLYAQKNKIPLEKAKRIVRKEYDKVGPYNLNWYRPSFWFGKFGFNRPHGKVISDMKKCVELYSETKKVLNKLNKKYPLIVITNSSNELVKYKIHAESISEYFRYVFSAIDDFQIVKKDPRIFRTMLKIFKIKPKQMVHVGDDWDFDYLAPKKLGIRAFYLDRKKEKPKNSDIVHDLKEFAERINEIEKGK